MLGHRIDNAYILKFIAFGVATAAGLVRVTLLPIELVGNWREFSSIITVLSQIFSIGLPTLLLLRVGDRTAELLFSAFSIAFCILAILSYLTILSLDVNLKYFTISISFVLALEIVTSHFGIKRGLYKNVLCANIIGYVFEFLFLILLSSYDNPDLSTLILAWLFVRSFINIFIIRYSLGSNYSRWTIRHQRQLAIVLRRAVPLSISNNFTPTLMASLMNSYDGIIFPFFVSDTTMGHTAIAILFKGMALLPLTVATQNIASKLRTSSLNSYKGELRIAQKVFTPLIIILTAGAFLLGEVTDNNTPFFLIFSAFLLTAINTFFGPVQTILMSRGYGMAAAGIDFFVIATMTLTIFTWHTSLSIYSEYSFFYLYISFSISALLIKYIVSRKITSKSLAPL